MLNLGMYPLEQSVERGIIFLLRVQNGHWLLPPKNINFLLLVSAILLVAMEWYLLSRLETLTCHLTESSDARGLSIIDLLVTIFILGSCEVTLYSQ